ncbi:MAG: Fic family protein [Gemmatimonadota bacterium]|nr:Fic family protein [Gemmatimonadota bacterium]
MFERFFTSTSENASAVSRALARGDVRRIRRGLYTTDLVTPLPTLVRQHIWEIVRLVAPGTVIGYRTALELAPSPEGVVHLVAPTEKRLDLHGTKLWIHEGPGPLDGDQPYMETLYLASRPRAFLECLKPSRSGKKFGDKGLPMEEIEERLERRLQARGEADLNSLRDQARRLRDDLDAAEELARLDAMIGTLLRTRGDAPVSDAGRSRVAGHPYDSDRLPLFQELHRTLLDAPTRDRPDPYSPGTDGFSNASFFDAYFSNWIEGTEFELEEARDIVLRGSVPEARPADGHDILGTFSLVSDPSFMREAMDRISSGPEAFIDVLHEAHARIMAGRPEHTPGVFKRKPNRAGSTQFVVPDLVRGTLREAHGLLDSLPDGFARAAYLMFVISEVHPYADGNGRVARAIMNAAMVAPGHTRIIVPTGYRDDYLRALKALSHQSNAQPFVRMLDRAQQLVSELPWSDYERTVELLNATNAMDESGDRRLRLPSEVPARNRP